MSVRKNYSCDTCGSSIGETDGIGIYHKANGDIQAVWLHKEGAGRHLCNRCVKGLRSMLAELDRTIQIQDELDSDMRRLAPEDLQPAELCKAPGGCNCGGDTPAVRAGCSWWSGQ